jgi:hypothetical protein
MVNSITNYAQDVPIYFFSFKTKKKNSIICDLRWVCLIRLDNAELQLFGIISSI